MTDTKNDEVIIAVEVPKNHTWCIEDIQVSALSWSLSHRILSGTPATVPNIDELMSLADEYAHAYAFIGDDTMQIRREELRAALLTSPATGSAVDETQIESIWQQAKHIVADRLKIDADCLREDYSPIRTEFARLLTAIPAPIVGEQTSPTVCPYCERLVADPCDTPFRKCDQVEIEQAAPFKTAPISVSTDGVTSVDPDDLLRSEKGQRDMRLLKQLGEQAAPMPPVEIEELEQISKAYGLLSAERDQLRARVGELTELLREMRSAHYSRPSCQYAVVDRCRCVACVSDRVDAALALAHSQQGEG